MSGGMSSGSSSYSSTPQNLQNPSFTNLAPGVASGLANLFGAGPNGTSTSGGTFSPFMAGGYSTKDTANNPLVAGLTPDQMQSLGNIFQGSQPGSFGGVTPTSSGADMNSFLNGSNFGNFGAASSLMKSFLDPNFASNLATSPQTQSAISSAISPLEQSFRNTTAPGLTGAATGAGQRASGPGQAGSSAFDQAWSGAQGNLMSTEAATAGQIANQAYQTGLNINAQAPSMASNLSGSELGQRIQAQNQPVNIGTTELNNFIQSLSAQVLPQLTQQYGINQGMQLYQTQIQSLLSALGLGTQAAQPAIAEQSQGQGSNSSFNLGLPSGFKFGG